MRILLVEDDIRLSQTLAEVFQKKLYGFDSVYNGFEGLKAARSDIYDLVILDATLPELDGLSVLRQMRQEKLDVPAMIISESGSVRDIVEALDVGADDYLKKPFDVAELLARCRALTRRERKIKETVLKFGDLVLSKGACELQNESGEGVKLSLKELQILELLFENPRQVINKEIIIDKIWGGDSDAEYNNVEVYISFIRRKIEQLNVDVQIRTARGIGYSFEEKKKELV